MYQFCSVHLYWWSKKPTESPWFKCISCAQFICGDEVKKKNWFTMVQLYQLGSAHLWWWSEEKKVSHNGSDVSVEFCSAVAIKNIAHTDIELMSWKCVYMHITDWIHNYNSIELMCIQFLYLFFLCSWRSHNVCR